MKTGFKDRTAIKEGKKEKSPWNFDCPPYDERSSCFVNAGTKYGVGITQPTGKFKARNSGVIPVGHPSTLKFDEIYNGKPGLFETTE